MSSGANVTWLSVLEDKQKELTLLNEQGYKIPDGPLEREGLRHGLDQLCKRYKSQSPNRVQLEYKYFDAVRHINDLAKGVTQSHPDLQKRPDHEGLDSLIRRLALATLEYGCKQGAGVSMLVCMLADLNSIVPQFSADVDRFPNDNQVQQPLQEVYSTLFNSYTEVLKILGRGNFRPTHDLRQDEQITVILAHTKAQIQDARARFDNSVSQAASREERERTIRQLPIHGSGSASRLKKQQERFSVDHSVIQELGKGSYGVVEEVEEQSTGSRYARKRIFFNRGWSREEVEKKVENEVWIMRNLRHQNIVTLAAFFKESNSFSILIHPVADYHLRQYFDICVENDYHESYTRHINPWFGCLLDALAFTHKNNIRHRDIKPTNILIKEKAVFLCDFGLAKDFTGQDSSASRGPRPEGTLEYRAPEVVSDHPRGRLADVFSLGCVFSEMLTTSNNRSPKEYREMRQEKPFRDCLPEVQIWVTQFKHHEHSPLLCNIIKSMLSKSPDQRIEAQKALDDLRTDRRLYGLD